MPVSGVYQAYLKKVERKGANESDLVKVEEIQDPLMKKIRYMDKLVDEIAKGRAMEKILRSSS